MDFDIYNNHPPGDPALVDKIVCQLKSQGIFDQFRKECLSDVDTKPAYQNLRQRVNGSVNGYLANQDWKPELNKNLLRENLRKHVQSGGFLDVGVERIVDQVVNPKIGQVFLPQVRELVFECLGIKKPTIPGQTDCSSTQPIKQEVQISPIKQEEKPCTTVVESPAPDVQEIKTEDVELKISVVKPNEEESNISSSNLLDDLRSENSEDSLVSGITELASLSHSSLSLNVSKESNASDNLDTIITNRSSIKNEDSRTSSLFEAPTPLTPNQSDTNISVQDNNSMSEFSDNVKREMNDMFKSDTFLQSPNNNGTDLNGLSDKNEPKNGQCNNLSDHDETDLEESSWTPKDKYNEPVKPLEIKVHEPHIPVVESGVDKETEEFIKKSDIDDVHSKQEELQESTSESKEIKDVEVRTPEQQQKCIELIMNRNDKTDDIQSSESLSDDNKHKIEEDEKYKKDKKDCSYGKSKHKEYQSKSHNSKSTHHNHHRSSREHNHSKDYVRDDSKDSKDSSSSTNNIDKRQEKSKSHDKPNNTRDNSKSQDFEKSKDDQKYKERTKSESSDSKYKHSSRSKHHSEYKLDSKSKNKVDPDLKDKHYRSTNNITKEEKQKISSKVYDKEVPQDHKINLKEPSSNSKDSKSSDHHKTVDKKRDDEYRSRPKEEKLEQRESRHHESRGKYREKKNGNDCDKSGKLQTDYKREEKKSSRSHGDGKHKVSPKSDDKHYDTKNEKVREERHKNESSKSKRNKESCRGYKHKEDRRSADRDSNGSGVKGSASSGNLWSIDSRQNGKESEGSSGSKNDSENSASDSNEPSTNDNSDAVCTETNLQVSKVDADKDATLSKLQSPLISLKKRLAHKVGKARTGSNIFGLKKVALAKKKFKNLSKIVKQSSEAFSYFRLHDVQSAINKSKFFKNYLNEMEGEIFVEGDDMSSALTVEKDYSSHKTDSEKIDTLSKDHIVDKHEDIVSNEKLQLTDINSCTFERTNSPVKLKISVRNPNDYNVIETEEILIYNENSSSTSVTNSNVGEDALPCSDVSEMVKQKRGHRKREFLNRNKLDFKENNLSDHHNVNTCFTSSSAELKCFEEEKSACKLLSNVKSFRSSQTTDMSHNVAQAVSSMLPFDSANEASNYQQSFSVKPSVSNEIDEPGNSLQPIKRKRNPSKKMKEESEICNSTEKNMSSNDCVKSSDRPQLSQFKEAKEEDSSQLGAKLKLSIRKVGKQCNVQAISPRSPASSDSVTFEYRDFDKSEIAKGAHTTSSAETNLSKAVKRKRGRRKKTDKGFKKHKANSEEPTLAISSSITSSQSAQNTEFDKREFDRKTLNEIKPQASLQNLSRYTVPQAVSPRLPLDSATGPCDYRQQCMDDAAVPDDGGIHILGTPDRGKTFKSYSDVGHRKRLKNKYLHTSDIDDEHCTATGKDTDIISPYHLNNNLSDASDYADMDDDPASEGENGLTNSMIGAALKDLMQESGLIGAIDNGLKKTSVPRLSEEVQLDTKKAKCQQENSKLPTTKLRRREINSKRYDNSDLYKPRLVFRQNSRRQRGDDPLSETNKSIYSTADVMLSNKKVR